MTTTKQLPNLTLDEALAALEAAVAERGEDFVYPKEWKDGSDPWNPVCQYAHNGKPACIVGLALHNLGVDVTELKNAPADMALKAAGVPGDWDDELHTMYTAAQATQDEGRTWGESLAAAKKAVGL